MFQDDSAGHLQAGAPQATGPQSPTETLQLVAEAADDIAVSFCC